MCVFVCVCVCVCAFVCVLFQDPSFSQSLEKKNYGKDWFSGTSPHDLTCNKKSKSSYPTTRVITVLWTQSYKDNSLVS